MITEADVDEVCSWLSGEELLAASRVLRERVRLRKDAREEAETLARQQGGLSPIGTPGSLSSPAAARSSA